MPTQDERFDDIAGGQIARVVHSEMCEMVAARESQIVKSLVATYRANQLTHEMMIGAIASIAELRGIIAKLEIQIKKGIEATEQERNVNPGIDG